MISLKIYIKIKKLLQGQAVLKWITTDQTESKVVRNEKNKNFRYGNETTRNY